MRQTKHLLRTNGFRFRRGLQKIVIYQMGKRGRGGSMGSEIEGWVEMTVRIGRTADIAATTNKRREMEGRKETGKETSRDGTKKLENKSSAPMQNDCPEMVPAETVVADLTSHGLGATRVRREETKLRKHRRSQANGAGREHRGGVQNGIDL
jgi:hypothetical protein